MLKAMHDLLRSALLFYLKLARFNGLDFKLNSYDLCVANKMVGGAMMTVAWHMYDLKVSHSSTAKIDKLIDC